jgi:glycosyltransferase involved in cell wall biosynthesis
VLSSTNELMVDSSSSRVIRVLAILEGTAVSGPAKNLLEFCRVSRSLGQPPVVSPLVVTFVRANRDGWTRAVGASKILEAANATGLEVHFIPERFPFDPDVIRRLRALVKRLDPNIIQTHHVKSHFLVRLSGLGRLYPWIAFHHGYTREGIRMRLYDQLDKWSLKGPSQIVTVCEPFKRQLVSWGVPPSRIMVLHNSISLDWLNERRIPSDGTSAAHNVSTTTLTSERVVLAVGRLSAEKAFGDLIMAMDHLRRLRRDLLVHLLILGDGPEKRQVEKLVRDLNLQDRISLPGHVHDVRPYYRRADVLAISSVSEGSPNVLLEAMSAGVPVVATAVGGIPELVANNETALLVEAHNPEALASAINLLLSNPDLAKTLVSNALQTIGRRHSPQDRARALQELYNRISCPNHKPSCMGS